MASGIDTFTELEALSNEFKLGLPARLQELATVLESFSRGTTGQASCPFSLALHLSHQLKQEGESFGPEWLSLAMHRIQWKLQKIATANQPLRENQIVELVMTLAPLMSRVEVPMGCRKSSAANTRLERGESLIAPRILLISDDAVFADRVKHVVEHHGLTLTTCSDTSQSFELVEGFAPALLLLDVELPGLSGLDVCRFLRSKPRWKHLPIVIITDSTPWAAHSLSLAIGATDYITKPVVTALLSARLLHHLRGIQCSASA